MMSRSQNVVESKSLPQMPPPPDPLSIPGVLILGINREPLYVTPIARKLLAKLEHPTNEPWGGTVLPLAVQQICNELQHDVHRDPAGTDWEKMQTRHLARTAHGTILLRGYGIFDQHSAQTGRFLILLEPAPAEVSLPDKDDAKDHQFTERQRAILNGLVHGHSNKEIANNLKISPHTVKEYVRQLMLKLHATSRTGVAAKVATLAVAVQKPTGHRSAETSPTAVPSI